MHLFTKTIVILRKIKIRCLKQKNTYNYSEKVQSICTANSILTFVEVTKKKEPTKKNPNTPPPKKKPSIKKGEHLLDCDFKVMRFSGIFIQRKR